MTASADAEKLLSLLEDARPDADPESLETIGILTLIADLVRDSMGWLHLRPRGSDSPSSVILYGEESALLVCLHGEIVEWLVGSRSLAERVLVRAQERFGDQELHLTAFVGDDSVGGFRLVGNQVDVSARTASALDRLAAAASQGLSALAEALMEIHLPVGPNHGLEESYA